MMTSEAHTFSATRCADRTKRRPRTGLTLLELIVVIAILAIVAGFVIPLAEYAETSSKFKISQASLTAIRDAIVGTANAPGYLGDNRQMPTTLRDLFINPGLPTFNRDTNTGWRGPYLLNANGQYKVGNSKDVSFNYGSYPNPYGYWDGGINGDPIILDGWGNAIVLQYPINTSTGLPDPTNQYGRLISAGPDGIIETSAGTEPGGYPLTSNRGDDLVQFLTHADSP